MVLTWLIMTLKEPLTRGEFLADSSAAGRAERAQGLISRVLAVSSAAEAWKGKWKRRAPAALPAASFRKVLLEIGSFIMDSLIDSSSSIDRSGGPLTIKAGLQMTGRAGENPGKGGFPAFLSVYLWSAKGITGDGKIRTKTVRFL